MPYSAIHRYNFMNYKMPEMDMHDQREEYFQF